MNAKLKMTKNNIMAASIILYVEGEIGRLIVFIRG